MRPDPNPDEQLGNDPKTHGAEHKQITSTPQRSSEPSRTLTRRSSRLDAQLLQTLCASVSGDCASQSMQASTQYRSFTLGS
jgi:hypothetical protein